MGRVVPSHHNRAVASTLNDLARSWAVLACTVEGLPFVVAIGTPLRGASLWLLRLRAIVTLCKWGTLRASSLARPYPNGWRPSTALCAVGDTLPTSTISNGFAFVNYNVN
mgnify:CR=1 FL=1